MKAKRLVILGLILALMRFPTPVLAQLANDPSLTAVKTQPLGVIPPLRADWTRTYVAADTTAANNRTDTVYSDWMIIPSACKFFPSVNIDGKSAWTLGAFDTLLVKDSVKINFQTSNDGNTILATTNLGVCIPGSADLDTTIAYAATLARDTVIMQARFLRSMFIMDDSAAANRPTFMSRKYGRVFWMYINSRP